MRIIDEMIKWRISVPIFKRWVILKQLCIAIGIPFGTLILVLIMLSNDSLYTFYAVILINTLLISTWIFIMVVYKGKYQVEFQLDRKGITSHTQKEQGKKNKIVNSLTVFLGFISGKPTVAGAGMLAQSREHVFISWRRITKVKCYPKDNTILVKSGYLDSIALFCTDENFVRVRDCILTKTKLTIQGRDHIQE